MKNTVYLYIKSASSDAVLYQAETDNNSLTKAAEEILNRYENDLHINVTDAQAVFCVHLMQKHNGGVVLERALIKRIASLGLGLCYSYSKQTQQ